MKKIEYMVPEMEVVELKYSYALLSASDPDDTVAPTTGDENTDIMP